MYTFSQSAWWCRGRGRLCACLHYEPRVQWGGWEGAGTSLGHLFHSLGQHDQWAFFFHSFFDENQVTVQSKKNSQNNKNGGLSSILSQGIPFAMGEMLPTVIGYFVRDWSMFQVLWTTLDIPNFTFGMCSSWPSPSSCWSPASPGSSSLSLQDIWSPRAKSPRWQRCWRRLPRGMGCPCHLRWWLRRRTLRGRRRRRRRSWRCTAWRICSAALSSRSPSPSSSLGQSSLFSITVTFHLKNKRPCQ